MSMSGELDTAELRAAVQDAWNGQYTVDCLNNVLVRFQDALVDPLRQPMPDATNRQQIQSMNVKLPGEVQEITLQNDVVAWILDFSDAVEVNEIEVLKLLLQAFRMNVDDRRRCESERETAISLYFNQRQDLLIALLDIVQMVEGDHEFNQELIRITQSFVERLKERGLVLNIINRLRALSKLKLSMYTCHIDNEIRLMSLTLFYIGLSSGLDSKASAEATFPNTVALNALTEEMSVVIPSVRLHLDHQQEVLAHCHSITTSIYIMFTTLINSMLESGVTSLPTWTNPNLQSPLANSHRTMTVALNHDQQLTEQICNSEESQHLIFQGFAGFGAFVQQLPSLNEVARVDMCCILSKFITHFFRRHLSYIRTWKDPKGTFLLFGSLVADICKRSPSQVATFWSCQNFATLLHSLDQETPPDDPGFSSYVDLMVALADGQHCARSVQFIGSAKNTNWHRVFDLFHRAVAPALKHDQSQTLLPLDIRILCDLARLVQIMARCGPTVTSVSFQQFQVLETLFQMLACAFPVKLKGELFTTLECWVQGRPAEAGQVWDRLEGMQVFPTLPDSSNSNPRGLLFDLEEIEARDGFFPLTRAFISLLITMIKVTPKVVLEKIGAPLRPPGIAPYLRFVRTYVFSKVNGRTYSDISEKWKVATTALRLLILLASPEDPDSTGTEILESFVRSGSPEVRAVIELILTNPDSATLEASLGLIRIVLYHEPMLVDRITRASQECLPLSVVLLRQPQTVAVLCQLIGSSFSLSIQAHAVEIVSYLARRDSTLIVRILSSQNLDHVVRRQWASQLLFASSDYENQRKVEQGIINVLKEISMWPSLAHLLLGFDVTASSTDTRLVYASDGSLSAVIDLVDKPGFLGASADVAVSGLNLICILLEDPVTSRPVFEYINLHHDLFFCNCLERLPLLTQERSQASMRIYYFLQTAWLLKSIALDLHLRRGDHILDESSAISYLGLRNATNASPLVITILDALRPEISGELPEFGGLDRQSCVALGKNALMSCIDTELNVFSKAHKSSGEFFWKIPKLRAAASHVGLNTKAVEKSAASFNETVRLLCSLRLSSQFWTQLIEVWLLDRDLSELNPTLLLDLLISVLGKISDPAWSQSSIYFANAALLLMVHIRAISTNAVIAVDHRIIQGILAGIVNNQNHQSRAQLCAAFYTYMDFMTTMESEKDCGSRGSEWALAQALSDLNLSPANLIQRICDHALSNSASVRALATSFLCAYPIDLLVPLLEQTSQLVRFIQGIHSSSDLHSAICADPLNYHLILAFESHFLFLLHISQTISGAKALVTADILSRLAACDFLDLRPSEISQSHYVSGHPTAMQKYLQLTIPYLRLIASVLTALPHRHDVHEKVVDILLVRYVKPFNAIIQSSKMLPESVEAYHAATSIVLCLVIGPVQSRSEIATAVQFLLQQVPVQAVVFRNSTNEASTEAFDDHGPLSLAKEITRDLVILCSFMAQRRLLVFDPNIDPRLDRQENDLIASAADEKLPLGIVVYYLIPGALTLLRTSCSKRSQLEQSLSNAQRFISAETDGLYENDHTALPRTRFTYALKSAQKEVQLAIVMIQNCLQIIYLSLRIFTSAPFESKQILNHVDRLREIINKVDAAFGVDFTDDLIEKQLSKIRQELDLAYGQKHQDVPANAIAPSFPLALESR